MMGGDVTPSCRVELADVQYICTYVHMDVCMDGWMYVWMDGWMDVHI